MDTLNLRTMARKSVFSEGKHKDRSVQQVLDLQHTRYLRWVYFNLSKISFLPDILDEIGITEEWRIEKPGKDPEKGEQLDEIFDTKIKAMRMFQYENNETDGLRQTRKAKSKEKKRRLAEYHEFLMDDKKHYSKGAMQRRNHGH